MSLTFENASKFTFFTGKGGTGKTSLASAYAVQLADNNKKVLLVCTDPASNLEQVFETKFSDSIIQIKNVPNLFAININPEEAAESYRQRAIKPLENKLNIIEIQNIREQLSGACTTEIASFDEFTRYLNISHFIVDNKEIEFDHIIFDTAPTGHTLRLLSLPAAWSNFIQDNPSGASCLGPQSALNTHLTEYKSALEILCDSKQTTLYLIARPDNNSIKEAKRAYLELLEIGIKKQHLIINGLFKSSNKSDLIANSIQNKQEEMLNKLPKELKNIDTSYVGLKAFNTVGINALRLLLTNENFIKEDTQKDLSKSNEKSLENISFDLIDKLIEELNRNKKGLILVMGKGGVGKSTIAKILANKLSNLGNHVHFSTTDPASDLDYMLENTNGNMIIDKIDPKIETEKYINHVLNTKGKNYNEEQKKLLIEDLQSPCTEEVAVFHAFSGLIREAARKFVIVDTAPTGHTLLLMDQTGAYHKEIVRNTETDMIDKIKTPFMRLQDPEFTKIILVSLAEHTPVSEAAQLQNDLKRAGIDVYSWIVNKSLLGLDLEDEILKFRAESEKFWINEIKEKYSSKIFINQFDYL